MMGGLSIIKAVAAPGYKLNGRQRNVCGVENALYINDSQ